MHIVWEIIERPSGSQRQSRPNPRRPRRRPRRAGNAAWQKHPRHRHPLPRPPRARCRLLQPIPTGRPHPQQRGPCHPATCGVKGVGVLSGGIFSLALSEFSLVLYGLHAAAAVLSWPMGRKMFSSFLNKLLFSNYTNFKSSKHL